MDNSKRGSIPIGDTKSQTGYVFILNGGAVVWKSFKQSTTAQHVTEAEYIDASEAAKEVVWIRTFIDELGEVPSNNYLIKMNCDNSAAIIVTPFFVKKTLCHNLGVISKHS
uniref:Putative retrotransposon protein n=1 Tax=Tanacetum cinerariifolium TaxID=118510 RepID=A0A699TGX2_TANCI|nr:putative retrotransposon protein [Tanacetum cinerariifolium]